MNYLWGLRRSGADWFSVGLTSSFPDLGLDDEDLSHSRLCNQDFKPGCKAFQVPKEDTSKSTELVIPAEGGEGDFQDQVLVFQYRGKFHAIDHVSQTGTSSTERRLIQGLYSHARILPFPSQRVFPLISKILGLFSARVSCVRSTAGRSIYSLETLIEEIID